MAGFLSTLRGGCKALFRSFTTALSALKKWFQHEIVPIIQEFASFIRHLFDNYVRPLISKAIQFAFDDPAAVAFGVFAIIIVIAYPWIITTPLLHILGFTILGPAAVSLAALAQCIIGNVAAASIFSILQSAGMGGAGLVTLNGVAVLILLIVVMSLFIVQRMGSEKRKKGEEESEKKRNRAF